ncbi:MAG TPA: response regulator [Syntrophorhabdaceae bacterium]|nr:response regulator [Syntrophorhabdaceae bacterium]HPP06536.1 response regulator [Syntrophorhabdaceae bacterium]
MHGKKILIVDDDPDIRLLVDFHMSEEGCEVIEASDGIEALEVLKDHHVDLIITDLTMPNMDGYKLIEALKASGDKSIIPILMLTGKEEERILREGLTHQPDDFLPKPFTKNELMEKIKRLLT